MCKKKKKTKLGTRLTFFTTKQKMLFDTPVQSLHHFLKKKIQSFFKFFDLLENFKAFVGLGGGGVGPFGGLPIFYFNVFTFTTVEHRQ